MVVPSSWDIGRFGTYPDDGRDDRREAGGTPRMLTPRAVLVGRQKNGMSQDCRHREVPIRHVAVRVVALEIASFPSIDVIDAVPTRMPDILGHPVGTLRERRRHGGATRAAPLLSTESLTKKRGRETVTRRVGHLSSDENGMTRSSRDGVGVVLQSDTENRMD